MDINLSVSARKREPTASWMMLRRVTSRWHERLHRRPAPEDGGARRAGDAKSEAGGDPSGEARVRGEDHRGEVSESTVSRPLRRLGRSRKRS